jgi:FeS assembly protein IscX
MTYEPPIHWNDHEDIAMKLYERFGDDFNEGKIYRVRFTDLYKWVLEIPKFAGKAEESTEGHLEMIQSAWVHEWRDGQK